MRMDEARAALREAVCGLGTTSITALTTVTDLTAVTDGDATTAVNAAGAAGDAAREGQAAALEAERKRREAARKAAVEAVAAAAGLPPPPARCGWPTVGLAQVVQKLAQVGMLVQRPHREPLSMLVP